MSRALTAFLVVISAAAGLADGITWHESFEDAIASAGQTGRPVLVVFSGGGDCGWCSEMAGETLVAPEVVALARSFEVAQVLALRRDDLSTRYMVATYPTVVFLSPDGEVIEKVSGYLPPEVFIEVMQGALDAHAALQQARALEAALVGQQPTPEQLLSVTRQYSLANSFERVVEWGNRVMACGDAAVRPEALLLVGKALVALDEPRQAIEPLREFITLAPEGEMAWTGKLHLGYAYLMTDQGDLGRPILQDVATNAPEDSRERTNALRLLEWLDGQG